MTRSVFFVRVVVVIVATAFLAALDGWYGLRASVETAAPVATSGGGTAMAGGWHVPARSVADLRGFGKVAATFAPKSAEFTCQNRAKADILLGKMLADMFWNHPDGQAGRWIQVGAKKVLIHTWRGYGAICVGRIGNRVLVMGAPNESTLADALGKRTSLLVAGVDFTPKQPYPIYLDFYDLRAFKAYTHAMGSVHGLGLKSHWPFIKQFGLGGLSIQSLGYNFHCSAPGVDEWIPSDYEVRHAQRQHGMIVPCIGTGEDPLWTWNLFPGGMMRAASSALIGAWGNAGCAGAHYESWGMSAAGREKTAWAYLCQAIRRYRNNPAVGGWLIYSGSPGAEFGMHERTAIFWDYSAPGEALFRHWLRTVKHESLGQVGVQWHGNAGYFHSWNDVKVPDLNRFFGHLDGSCLRINRHWKWRAVGKAPAVNPPAEHTPGWIPVAMPPSEQQMFLPWEASFYRTHFNASMWLARNPGKSVYLVCATDTRTNHSIRVWLNGRDLGKHKSRQTGWGPFALKVNGLLNAGLNRLVVKVPGPEGKVFGPVFLTTTRPAYYPNLGRHENARFVDLEQWQRWANIHVLRRTLEVAESLDPNRPMVISGAAGGVTSDVAALASRFGCGVEFTGDGGFYHPWWDGLGLTDHFNATGEEGGTESGWMLSRELGWNMMDGDSSHSLFWDIEDYIQQQNATDWFGKRKRLIQLFGKAVRAKPRIVILRSSLGLQVGAAPFDWDIGRGELQAAHYDNAYATGRDLVSGAVGRYNPPVLFDAGTEYMSGKVIAALRRYVENGGTFIALQNTGRNTPVTSNGWPISELTGFKVVATGQTGRIRFGKNLPIFRQWAGREFKGQGAAVDWLHQDHAKGGGIGLKRHGAGTAILARWKKDGTGAVGYRTLGKGRIIVLGSTFWRNGRDIKGQWQTQGQLERAFFHTLFSDLGIRRRTDADSPQVWTREFITKNGLQKWLMAFNDAGSAITTDVKFRAKARPAQVINELTHKPVAFTYSPDGWVVIPGVSMPTYAVDVFAVRQADLAEGVAFWWRHKTLYWKMPRILTKATRWADAASDERKWDRRFALNMDRWKFYADKDGKLVAGTAWRRASFDDARWRDVQDGPWHWYAKSLTNYHGIGLYRRRFTLPTAWKGRQILLNFYNFNNPIAYDHAEFYVNGSLVATYQKRGGSQTLNFDITQHLRFGARNVLAVKVWGGKRFSGLCGEVFLTPEVKLQPELSLNGGWKAMQANFSTVKKVTLPGKAVGRCLLREVKIPANWAARNVYLHVQTPSQWLGSVVVNGHPINYNSYVHPFGLMADINVTPYLRLGRDNQIQLWPYAAMPASGRTDNGHVAMDIQAINIGCVVQPAMTAVK